MITSCKFIGISHEIKDDGQIRCCGSWIIVSDQILEKEAYTDALNWSGKANEPFRFPNLDNQSYSLDENLKVHDILIKNCEDNFTFQIDFISKNIQIQQSLGDEDISFDPQNPTKLILYKKEKSFRTAEYDGVLTVFVYHYYGDIHELSMPKQGENITIDGENYFCCDLKVSQAKEFKFSLEITAVKLGSNAKLVSEITDNAKRSKVLKYFVYTSNYDEFLKNFELFQNSPLAGDDYYLQSIQTKDGNSYGRFIDLTFRKIKTELLEYSREEELTGFIEGEIPNSEVFFYSTWQVHADDIERFKNITGTFADWAEADNIITKVTPKKLSELEYEVKIEAQLLSNSSLYKSYNTGDFHSLNNRIDYKAQWVDFKLSAQQCGYVILPDTSFFPMQGWEALTDCPFESSSQLPIDLINSISKLLQLTEITYAKGSIKRNIEKLISWGIDRVFEGKIAGYYGSYLKSDLKTSEIFDSRGRRWTMISKIYLLAPCGKQWNSNYWNSKV